MFWRTPKKNRIVEECALAWLEAEEKAENIDHTILNDLTPAKRVEVLMALGEEALNEDIDCNCSYLYTHYDCIIDAAMKRCGLEEKER